MLKTILFTALITFSLTAGGFLYFRGEAVESPNILIKEVTTEIPCEKIKVYKTKKAKKLARLPQSVSKSPNLHLVASTRIPDDGHTHVVSAVYDQSRGDVRLFDYKEPKKWLDFNKKTSLEIAYGNSDLEKGVTQITGHYQFAQIKKVKVSLMGSYRTDKSHYYGLGIRYTF